MGRRDAGEVGNERGGMGKGYGIELWGNLMKQVKKSL